MACVSFDMLVGTLASFLSLRANTAKCKHSEACGCPCHASIHNEKNTFLNIGRNDVNETSNKRPRAYQGVPVKETAGPTLGLSSSVDRNS